MLTGSGRLSQSPAPYQLDLSRIPTAVLTLDGKAYTTEHSADQPDDRLYQVLIRVLAARAQLPAIPYAIKDASGECWPWRGLGRAEEILHQDPAHGPAGRIRRVLQVFLLMLLLNPTMEALESSTPAAP